MPTYSQTLTVWLFTDARVVALTDVNLLTAMRTLVCKAALANGGAGTYLKYSGLGTLANVSIRLDTPPGITSYGDVVRRGDLDGVLECARISDPNATIKDLRRRARRLLHVGNSVVVETTDYSVYGHASYMIERFLRTRFSGHELFGAPGNGVGEGYFETNNPP